MKKGTLLLFVLLISTAIFFVGCDDNTTPEKTSAPIITQKPTQEKTATPIPTVEPTATPDPYANDIMGYAVDDCTYGGDGVTGDGWSSSPGGWWGPLQEGDGNATRTFGIISFLDNIELSNGKEGSAVSLTWNCDTEFDRGQLVGLNYGLQGMLEPNKVYKAVLTYRLTFGPDGPVEGHNTRLWYSAAVEATSTNGFLLEETENWKTVEYYFKTGDDVDENVYIQMGPSCHNNMAGWVKNGFELLVERVSLTLYDGEVTFEQ